MTKQKLEELCNNLLKIRNEAEEDNPYLVRAISICKRLIGKERDFDAETVLRYLTGLKEKNEEVLASSKNLYEYCKSLKDDNIDQEMEKTIERAERIMNGKMRTYTTSKEKLESDSNFNKYIKSKIKRISTNPKVVSEILQQSKNTTSQSDNVDVIVG